MEGKYLITTDDWFYASDGRKYKSVWGDVHILEDKILGVNTNRNSSNWYAYVGSKEKGVVVAGCQIHYAVNCNSQPHAGPVSESMSGESGLSRFERPSEIYIAE